jgi:hypothetical protein
MTRLASRAGAAGFVGCLSLIVLLASAVSPARGADWPQYRGINRDGASAETGWLQTWPPTVVWRAAIGYGFSSMAVSEGRVYATGVYRYGSVYTPSGTDTVYCFDAYTGKTNWTYSYASDWPGLYPGTKATPTIDGTNVYTFSDCGVLYCFDKVMGTLKWQTNLAMGSGGGWGYVGSPLVDGNLVIVNSGGGVAVNKNTGATVWSNSGSAGCGSPKAITCNSQRIILMPLTSGSSGLNETTGAALSGWGFSVSGEANADSEDPELYGTNEFFCNSALWQFSGSGITQIWQEDYTVPAMSPACSTTVIVGDYAYGFYNGDTLRCDSLLTHTSKWGAGMNEGTVIASDGKLICFSGDGKLNVCDATPTGYNTHGRAAYGGIVTLPDNSGSTKVANLACPALADGLLYCRSWSGDLVCLSCGSAYGSWSNRMEIAFPGYTNAETLTNFPAYVVLNTNQVNFLYSQFVSTNGYDLRFTSSDGLTNLNYEVESWNPNGNSCIWVQVPQFTNQCSIWAFWGNASAASAPAIYTTNGATWSSQFSLVEHMNQTSGSTVNDSTANRFTGTIMGAYTWTNSGIVDGCVQMPPVGNDSITMNNTVNVGTTNDWTMSAWFKGVLPNTGNRMLFYAHDGAKGMYDGHMIELLSGSDAVENYASHFNDYPSSPPVIITAASSSNQWQQITAVGTGPINAAGGVTTLFLNGVYGGVCADKECPVINSINGMVYGTVNSGFQFAQYLYEVRIETAGRSTNWVWASYMTVASNASFTIYGGGPIGAVQFSGASYGAMEDDGSALITVTRTNGSAGAITVNYTTANGTATAGTDYTATGGTLTFVGGVTNQTFAIPILNPGIPSGSRTVNIVLSNPTGGVLMGSPSNAVLTITDDDVPGTVQFSGAAYSIAEGGGTATITVARTNGSYGAITVNYTTANGTGTAGTDYTATNGTLNFATGVKSRTFTIPIINGGVLAPDKTVNLTLSNPTGGASLGSQSNAVLTIIGNKAGTVQFSGASYSAIENGSTATITVTRTNGLTGAITVNYNTADGTAVAGTDYTAASGTLTFAGGVTSQTFTVTILDDGLGGTNTTVNIALSNPTGSASIGSQSNAVLTIANINGPASLNSWACKMKISFPGYTNSETLASFPALVELGTNLPGFSYNQFVSTNGYDLCFWSSDGTTNLNYEVESWNPSTGSGQATNGKSCYWVQVPALTNGSYIWTTWGNTNPVYASAAAACTANGSTWSNGFQLVQHMNQTSGSQVNDSSPNHYGGAAIQGTGVWTNNGVIAGGLECPTNGSLNNGIYMGGVQLCSSWTMSLWFENTVANGGVVFSATGSDPDDIAIAGGSGGYDVSYYRTGNYYNSPCAVTPSSSANQWQQLTCVGAGGITSIYLNGVYGGSCNAQMQLYTDIRCIGMWSDNGGYNWGRQFAQYLDEARIESVNRSANWIWASYMTVASNGVFNNYGTIGTASGVVQFASASCSVSEGGGFATIQVSRTGGISRSITVNYATAGGTALAGTDYTATNGTLSFAAWETSGTFTVPILNPGIAGPDKTVNLSLSNPTGGTALGNSANAVLTIINDNGACRMKIAFSSYNRAEILTNFPALVVLSTNLSGFAYSQFGSANGYDLRFSSSDNSQELNYEVEQWNPNGNSYVWVQIPQLSSNCYIWASWDNTDSSVISAPSIYATNGSVWPTNAFAGVWHMGQSSALDSTANRNNGSAVGNITNATGLICGAEGVAGGYVQVADSPTFDSISGAMTISGWVRFNSLPTTEQAITRKDNQWELGTSDNGTKMRSLLNTASPSGWTIGNDDAFSPGLSVGQWYYFAFSYNGAAGQLWNFENGVPIGASPHSIGGTITPNNNNPGLGGCSAGETLVNAIIDELRVERVFRSTNWVWAAYRTVASNGSFTVYGSVQGYSGTNAPTTGIPPSAWIQQYFPGTPTNNYASLATNDANGNGMTVWQDYVAGINPTNCNSCFSVIITNLAGQILVIVPSVQTNSDYSGVNRYYEIDECTNLMAGGGWQPAPGYTGLQASGGIIACTNAPGCQNTFYRAKAKLQ